MGLPSKFFLLACLACLYPNIQALSIPTTHTPGIHDDSSEETTTIANDANPNDDVNDGLGDLDSGENLQNFVNQSSETFSEGL